MTIDAVRYLNSKAMNGLNLYAYCANNPVIYEDPSGEFAILIAAMIIVVLIGFTSCELSVETENPQSLLQDNSQFSKTPDDISRDESLDISINLDNVHNWSNDNDKIRKYTNLLADDIEYRYSEYLDGNKIDRVQLYSEIKFHIVCWDAGLFTDSANPINLNIYSNGNVIDPREWLNPLVRNYYGGEYYE